MCVLLANYLSALDFSVRVIDADPQHSLLNARKADLKSDENHSPLFEIQRFELHNQLNKLPEYVRELKKTGAHVLFDAPGSMENDLYMHIVMLSDVVIVPFQYEEYSIVATGEYATVLKKLEEAYPMLKRIAIYVPNMVDTRVGRVADRKRWDAWDKDIDGVAIRSPRVPLRACIQRRNTLYMTPEEMVCVTPCFEFIVNRIFQNTSDDKLNRSVKQSTNAGVQSENSVEQLTNLGRQLNRLDKQPNSKGGRSNSIDMRTDSLSG